MYDFYTRFRSPAFGKEEAVPMKKSMETKWLHNPLPCDQTLYYGLKEGVSVEHMVRPSSFDMRCNHFHSEYEIYFLLRGKRRLFFGNRSYLMEAGTLALIDTNRIHMTCSVPDDAGSHYERIILYLRKEKVEEYDQAFPELEMASFFQQHNGIFVLSAEAQEQTMEMFQTVMRELEGQQGKRRALIDLEIIRFFIQFWRVNRPVSYLIDEQRSREKGKYATVYAVSDYISVHFREPITLERLAEEFYVSKSYLSRSFKEVVGFGFREYVNILRIRQAQEMLEDPGLSISEISETVGFESVSYFGQVFQKHLAISPSQYRRDFLNMSLNPAPSKK